MCRGGEGTAIGDLDSGIESRVAENAVVSRIRGCRGDCAGESHSAGYDEGCPGGHGPENGSLGGGTGSAGAETICCPPGCANPVGCDSPRSHGVVIHAVTSVCPLGCETAAPRL